MSLAGKTVAMTGALSRTRNEYVAIIESNGGIYAPSVTKKVTHLVAAEPDGASTKLEKARKNGIIVVGEDFLLNPENAAIWTTTTQIQKPQINPEVQLLLRNLKNKQENYPV